MNSRQHTGRHPGQRHSPVSRHRRGISLLELLLAISLGIVLIGGMYGAMDQSARQTSIGRVEMERLQIARAVLRRLELDLRATMFDPKTAISDGENVGGYSNDTSGSGGEGAVDTGSGNTAGTGTPTEDGGSSTGSSGENSSSTTVVSTSESESEWTGSLGIRGTATEIWIDQSRVRRDVVFTTVALNAVSDLKTVTYFLTNSSQPVETSAEASPIVLNDADGVGLARSEGDRSILRSLNPAGGALPGTVEVLAPEINSLKFRYFDGLSWYESWDSATNGALPRAVEISIGFEAAPDIPGYLANSAVSPSTQSFRLVVAIPVSDPLSTEDNG